MTSTTFFIIFIPILAILLLAINLILAPHNPYQEKDSVFECGFHSFLGQNRTQFSVSFFIFALLFLLFDLEILLVYPYSVSTYTNDVYGLAVLMIFFVLLTLGFIFELGKNALTIDSRQTSSYTSVDTTIAHIFLNKFSLKSTAPIANLTKKEYTILMILGVATVLLAICPAPMLNTLDSSLSTVFYNLDSIIQLSSGLLTTKEKEVLQKADDFDQTVMSNTSSVTTLREQSKDDVELLNSNVEKETAAIIEKKTEIVADLQETADRNASLVDDCKEKMDVVNDAATQAISELKAAANIAVEQLLEAQPIIDSIIFVADLAIVDSLVSFLAVFSVLLKFY